MGRKSDIWYWTYAKGFYTTIKGVRQFLARGPNDEAEKGPVYLEACKRFREALNLYHADEMGDTNTLHAICERYLDWVQRHRSPGTYRIRRESLSLVVQVLGATEAKDLHPRHVNESLENLTPKDRPRRTKKEHYANNTLKMAHCSLMAALNWAAGDGGLISANPLRGLESPPGESRGLEVLVTPAQHQLALSLAKGWLRDFLVCLEATGCRPGELANAQAIHWREELKALVYHGKGRNRRGQHQHKTAYTGKDRVIYFTGEGLKVIESRIRDNPIGYLFPGKKGQRKSMAVITRSFERLKHKMGLPHYIATGYRHTFATRALRLGWSVDMVAGLLGNSPAVIRQHYGHLADDCQAMRLSMERVRREMAGDGESP